MIRDATKRVMPGKALGVTIGVCSSRYARSNAAGSRGVGYKTMILAPAISPPLGV